MTASDPVQSFTRVGVNARFRIADRTSDPLFGMAELSIMANQQDIGKLTIGATMQIVPAMPALRNEVRPWLPS